MRCLSNLGLIGLLTMIAVACTEQNDSAVLDSAVGRKDGGAVDSRFAADGPRTDGLTRDAGKDLVPPADQSQPEDGTRLDSGGRDQSSPADKGLPDASKPDANSPDLGAPDLGAPDLGAPDLAGPDGSVGCKTDKDCDDGIACTHDLCSPQGLCRNLIKGGTCLVNGKCYASGQSDPSNSCMRCDPLLADDAFTPNSGAPCDDGESCTHADVCRLGACVGTKYSCRDGISCTDDLCDGKGGCSYPVQAKQCLIDGACWPDGAVNPLRRCQVCDAKNSPTAWGGRCFPDTCGLPTDCGLNESCISMTGTKGYCTPTCADSLSGAICSGTPAGTRAYCSPLGTPGTTGVCAFICQLTQAGQTQTFKCPGQLNCGQTINLGNASYRICEP
ncbi:MAG: hypothetical protein H6707_00370 [Deltaproteobacteria bacterium]|nr:hypothetical protein [Deltaproteobacteria bacterium]